MARYFDGATTALTSSTAFLSGASAFTIALWWRPTSLTGGTQCLLQGYGAGSNEWKIMFESTANAVSFSSTGYTGTNPATDSATAGLTAADVYDGKRILYRYNGTAWVVWTSSRTQGIVKKSISTSVSFTLPTITALRVGTDTANYADGGLAEIAIWDYALQDAEAESVMRGVSPDSIGVPKAYWPLRGYSDPEPDYLGLPSLSGGSPLTIFGAAHEQHPPVVGPDWIAAPQAAWALEVQSATGTVLAATSDLTDPVDVDVLGSAYHQRIVDAESVVVSKSIESGIVMPGTTSVILTNDRHATPDQLSGLALWLEADKIRTAADGADVATWADQSGRGLDALAYGGGATGPAFDADGINGLPALTFTATADSLALASGSPTTTGDYTVVTVFTRDDADTGTHAVLSGVSSSWIMYTSGGSVKVDMGSTLTLGAVKSTGLPYVASYVARDGTGFARVDQGTWQTASISHHPGSRLVIGTNNGPGLDLDGKVACVLVYNRALRVDELTKLENYLAAKYGDAAVPHGTLTRNTELRGVRAILRRYERTSHELVTELVGVVADVDFSRPGQVALTITGAAADKLQERIPKALVTVDEFPTATDLLAPIPVGFGQFWVSAPYVAHDKDGSPGSEDYLVAHHEDAGGADMSIRVESVKMDYASNVPGLESLTSWYTVGGTTPTRVSNAVLQLSADYRLYYEAGMPLKITISSVDYYTHVVSYDTGTNRVTVADSVVTSNPSAVAVLAGAYIVQTAEHATGTADLVSVRLVGIEAAGGIVVFARNHTLTNPADVIEEILRNSVWGLGQTVDAGTFLVAATEYTTASLDGACNYALGADRQQRPAREVLAEVLGLRGAWLDLSESGSWRLYVDSVPVWDQFRTFGVGDGAWNNIERLQSHIRTPLGSAVKTLKLRFRKKGRTRSSEGVTSWLAPSDYELQVNAPVLSVGSDRIETNPWVQTAGVASRVCAYRAKRLAAEDESIAFVAGFGSRNVSVGEIVRVVIPHSQVDRDVRVIGYERGLRATLLRTVGYSDTIFDYSASDVTYDDGAGANTSTDTVAVDDNSGLPAVGPNLLLDANFALGLGNTYTPATTKADAATMPGWIISEGDSGSTAISALAVARSERWVGLSYVELTIANTNGDPKLISNPRLDNIVTDGGFVVTPGQAYILSAYITETAATNPQSARGFGFTLNWYQSDGTASATASESPKLRTTGELTGPSTERALRWYATTRAPSDAAYGRLSITFSATGTYQVGGVGFQAVNRFVYGPPPWSNGVYES